MADGSAARSVADALLEVERRQGEEVARHQAELAEVDQEVESLRTAMANLQQQLDALAKFREELSAKLESVSGGAPQRSYDAIFGALREQAQELSGRAAAVADVQRAREADLAQTLADADVKALLEEYEQFKLQVEPTLAALPDSYRDVIVKHHEEVKGKLRTSLGDKINTPAEVDAASMSLDVVVAVDAPQGVAEVVMLVLPVVEQVQTAWSDREEDLQTWVAARVMQATYHLCHSIGLAGAQAMYGGHQGLLAVEIELGAGDPEEVRNGLISTIDQVLNEAPELVAAHVAPRAHAVEVDHLFPPDEGEPEPPAPDAGTDGAQEVSSAG